MEITTLLADPEAIRLEKIVPDRSSLTLVVRTRPTQSECPRCHRPSARVHSYYTRKVADLPWHGVAVRLLLRTRRFRCKNNLCTKRIFCERLPRVVSHYARKTRRISQALELIGFQLGGEAGARATLKLAIKTSPDTLLRRVRQAASPSIVTPRVLGVDDFAFRKRKRYGTILVDLQQHRPIDILPDRAGETLSRWLTAHPGVETVSRDRSQAYAGGINEGAPKAVQVVDRWHLLKNARDALERPLLRQNRVLRSQTMAVKLRAKPPVELGCHEQCRLRLLPQLKGSGRKAPMQGRRAPAKLPSPRQAAWLLLAEKLKEDEQQMVAELCELAPEIKRAQELAQGFVAIVKERKVEQLRPWLIEATRSAIPEFVGFARGITEDLEAVRAALLYEWSNGETEGQVNRLKTIKRKMYGRAKFDLLRARVLRVA